ncbi:hypothetical protein U9M48_019198 [Paspalum notatum var. saurae]|uniref:Reverse transcriptase domain-containing protein n=1 Tax=Paspalum notatum var. saurae TaxID=547442 RepID=A0AAQ3TBQ0_PASNO
MNSVFRKLLRHGVLVFMDDILIYTATLHEYVKLLREVLNIIDKHQFCINLSKCSFAQKAIEYLGHCISALGVATEPSKIRAVQAWPVPSSAKALRGFLGLTGYYRKFIRNYGMLARPLTQLLKKGALVQAPVLAILDFSKPFIVETDASDCGLGAVLMQEGHPVAYLSKSLSGKNIGLSTYEECMAILMAMEKWHPYLQNGEFLLKTEHKSLTYLTEQRATTKLQLKALLKLMDLRYKIVYKKGCTNLAADALSRCQSQGTVTAVSTCTPVWQDRVIEGYEDDPMAQKLLTELSVSSDNKHGYSLHNGVIRFKGRVWLGNNSLAHQHVMQALHSSGIGGHSGFHVTYNRIKRLFAWPKMKEAIKEFVQCCSVCQKAKGEHVKAPGLLEPLPVPTQPWTLVSLDFVEVVVDKLTKYGHFIPLAHPFSALQVAQAHMSNWSQLPPSLATWEKEVDLHRRFSAAPVWGQPGFQGGGSIMAQERIIKSGLAQHAAAAPPALAPGGRAKNCCRRRANARKKGGVPAARSSGRSGAGREGQALL